MLSEHLSFHLDAIIDREWANITPKLQVAGTQSPTVIGLLLSQTLSKEINSLPRLVVVPSSSDARRVAESVQAFAPRQRVFVCPHFDVSPYVGLYPKPQLMFERLRFLFAATSAQKNDIFVAPVGALQQLTLPPENFLAPAFSIKTGLDLPQGLPGVLEAMGYVAAPAVEECGQFAVRGGIVDIFSPAHEYPVRIELFGDTVESLRQFQVVDQRSLATIQTYQIIPARELLFDDDNLEYGAKQFRQSLAGRELDQSEMDEALRGLSRKNWFQGAEFLLPFFHEKLSSVLEYFSSPLTTVWVDPLEISRQADLLIEEMKNDYAGASRQVIRPEVSSLFQSFDQIELPADSREIEFVAVQSENFSEATEVKVIPYPSFNLNDLTQGLSAQTVGTEAWIGVLKKKLDQWRSDKYRVYVASKSKAQSERLKLFFEKASAQLNLFEQSLPESFRLVDERLIFIREEDILGRKGKSRQTSASEDFQTKARRMSFGDLKPGDFVVHVKHGIGIYEGLKVMPIAGADSEFIQIAYKDKDKLYLPVYNVGQLQKYSGAAAQVGLDKLGGIGWEKTKTKVRAHLRDIAADLLNLYAKRAEIHRPAFQFNENDYAAFEAAFPYDETDDQLRAISDFKKDLQSTRPMDRLICGDVGFGKTEVAMRAAFVVASCRKQVAVLAPTTVLTFQHFETFKKRFAGWPIDIRVLNRFVSNADAKKTIQDLKDGKVDIIIGTHRLLSKDVAFKDLGLLIIDEEQKFGVTHKEKVRKLRTNVDTLAMSATPIPRTLNLSLVGVRDLSLISTAPVDRLPTRTFVSKFEEEAVRKAILSELKRGGQVYFIHNRVQSIYGLADELRRLVPEARMKVGHGQMEEHELEQTMIQFFHHEIDVLVCTTIVESGMDIPKANTMFVDQAQMFGLSQLYQLRGRVGRSKQRAYCYLIVPPDKKIDKDAQERLKVLQEHTALGSGIHIAQYDLELRGAGNILGEEQSGHINTVGYELYMDLLNEAIHDLRGDPQEDSNIDPEINLRIPAMIPDSYIPDIRMRLSYYKALSEVREEQDIDQIEEELKDQFGDIPEPTLNLMGLMLIRAQCKKLGIRDVSAGLKNISLIFTEKTKLSTETVIRLAMRENKKYSVTPDNRLNIRMNAISWPNVSEELSYLLTLV